MKLADYLSDAEIRASVFAERIGVTRQTLWRYMSGERRPEWDVLERIAQATGGQVTPNDFLDATEAQLGGVSEPSVPEEVAAELPRETPCPEPVGLTPRDAGRAA